VVQTIHVATNKILHQDSLYNAKMSPIIKIMFIVTSVYVDVTQYTVKECVSALFRYIHLVVRKLAKIILL
jgi:hypothetical protein